MQGRQMQRRNPRVIWGEIWADFSIRREKDRTSAYLTLLRNLSNNGSVLVPELISPKDFADMVIHVESFVKSDTGTKEGSAIEAVQRFLNGPDERSIQSASKLASNKVQ
jgi:hypothetical protein